MSLPALSIRNHRFTQVVVALFSALGLVSFMTMPRSEDPFFDIPVASVVVVFPGADPEVIEALVVDPLEEAIREIEQLKTLETRVQDGVAVLAIEMLTGTNSDDAYNAVLQKVTEVLPELPDEVRSVEVIKPSLADVSIIQLALVADGNPASLPELAARLERRIERAPGVKRVDRLGYADREVRVSLDAERIRALGISIDQVAGAVQSAGANVPGGFVTVGDRRMNVVTSGDFDSLQEIERALIPGITPGLVRVGDVARVEWTTEDEEHRTRFQGNPAVFLSVVQREGTNIFRVLEGVYPIVAAAETELPAGVTLHTVFDQSVSVATRVSGFFSSLLQGILLVGVVMLLFVGLRPALLVIITIPLAILFALGGVDLSGYGLQQMSIVGLVIALGLLVDDAIVVVDNIGRIMRQGRSALEAAVEGTNEVAWPSVSGTVTTVLAFLPMVAIPSTTGQYMRSLPVTVIYALLASLFLSLTLTPLMASRLLARKERRAAIAARPRGSGWLHKPLERIAQGPYRRLLTAGVRHPWRVVGTGVGTMALAFGLLPFVGVSLFPKAEKPQFLISVETPEGTALDATDAVVRSVERLVAARPEVVRFAGNVGADNPQVYYNVRPRRAQSNIGQVLVELDHYRSAATVVPALREELDRLPGARFSIIEFENGPPVEAPIVFKVTGPELETLKDLAARIERVLRETPGTQNVRNPLGVQKSDLQVRIDRDRLTLLGLDPLAVKRTIRASIAGLKVGRFRDAKGEESDIVLRLSFQGNRATPEDLYRITFINAQGAPVPLAQVATIELTPATGRIDHYNTERVATVTAYPTGGVSVLEVTSAVSDKLGTLDWPAEYRWFASGTFEEQQEGFSGMIRALLVAVLGIYAVLVLQFRSFVQPLVIFASVPLAFVGAVLALLLTGYTFSITAFIGITGLVGIVVNNSIILVDYANRRVAAGDSIEEALLTAGETRFQPIVLTTLTTVSGLLPLTLTGSSMWSPLGWTIIGGLLTSTLLTLVLVPALYRIAARLEARSVTTEPAPASVVA